MKELWWECPRCEKKVYFLKQLSEIFDDNGEAKFEPSLSMGYDYIRCDCGAKWIISISGILP